jgi:hypothetical protein
VTKRLREAEEECDVLFIAQHNATRASFWVWRRLYDRACVQRNALRLKARMYRVA